MLNQILKKIAIILVIGTSPLLALNPIEEPNFPIICSLDLSKPMIEAILTTTLYLIYNDITKTYYETIKKSTQPLSFMDKVSLSPVGAFDEFFIGMPSRSRYENRRLYRGDEEVSSIRGIYVFLQNFFSQTPETRTPKNIKSPE